ncbi:hypothetical protein KC336_g19804 [Hortaea werneckii]|nr:hypothetical protein KC336_g19804 [Hortaea werneckii]
MQASSEKAYNSLAKDYKTALSKQGKQREEAILGDSDEEESGEEAPQKNMEAFVDDTGLPKPHEWAEDSELLGIEKGKAAVGTSKRKQTDENEELGKKKEKTTKKKKKKRSFAPIEEGQEGENTDLRGMTAEEVEEIVKDW